ncbi:MAG: helix-turn-helix transcriptional regulator [Bacteroidetes bacterium]|nr:helix-turn-helix transcriptional regulator [Bacteroidota bacterium]
MFFVLNMEKLTNHPITEREKEVISLIYKGLTYNEIADNLIISPATVRKHTENIYRKLSVHNKVEAIHKCIEKKILKF